MTDQAAEGWLRRNVGAVVAWVLILLSSAFVVGVTSASVSRTADDVSELVLRADTAKGERANIRSDVRVLETRHVATESAVSRMSGILDRLDRAVTRLEALAGAVRPHP